MRRQKRGSAKVQFGRCNYEDLKIRHAERMPSIVGIAINQHHSLKNVEYQING